MNRLGNERLLITAGKTWSDKPLPLSKLFAGNGFLIDNSALYYFGGMQTMYPYAYYSDQFINLYFRHDLDFRLYNLIISPHKISSAPKPALAYNVLWGSLDHPEVHQLVEFSTPWQGYHEAGLLLDNLIRLNYFDVAYLTINVGYFYHITPVFDAGKNGKFVFGLGFEL